MNMHRVAITGLGIVSSIGCSLTEVSKSLRTGRSGIVQDHIRTEMGFISPFTGVISNFSPTFPLSRKQRKTMPEFVQWAAEAAFAALTHAGLTPEDIHNDKTGLVFGCDSSCLAAIEQTQKLLKTKSTASLGSGLVFQSMTSCITMNLNAILQTKGAAWTISGACASGGHAVGQAADMIMLGRQERIICGAAQEINWQSMCSFDGLGAFAAPTSSTHAASRPFDASRTGLVPSGGAAAIVLERYDLAEQRGATILGEVKGYGFSSDGENISVPSETGLARAMRMALNAAKLFPQDISLVCAHATATPLGDTCEAQNLLHIFPEKSVPVTATKSMTGHELWMAGAAQVVYATLMAQHGFIAPTINLAEPDAVSAKLDIVQTLRPASLANILCNSAGFGGTNASLILGFQ
ncbi:beta-ketoacyl-[acyl-carrier-protein] synthase family protein [Desulfovibrionales bacterium]